MRPGVPAALVAEELVVAAEGLGRAEVAQARSHAAVLFDVQTQVQEGLVASRHRLATQAPRLVRQGAL